MATESVWSWSKTAANNATADSGINYAELQAPSTINNSGRGVMAAVAKWRDDTSGALTLAGGTTVYTLTTNQGLPALVDGVSLLAVCNATNTGASTLNVDALGAKAIRKLVTITGEVALSAGDMVAGGHYHFNYDASANSAAGAWILTNPASTPSGAYTSKTANYTVTTADLGGIVAVDCTGGAVTITLPSAATAGNGAEITIVKTDVSGSFVTIASVNDELLGYPSAKYSFHGTAGTAVSDNGGFVRVTMSAENRVFVTGDLARISGVVGFDDLNDDFTVTRPDASSGVSATAIDLTLAYAAGYSSGGTVQWIQKTQKLRVCNGTVTYKSNGTLWVVKHATPDVWTGPKDYLFNERNSTYAGPGIPGVGPAGAAGNLSAVYNAYSRRPIFENAAFIQNTDPVDLIVGIMYREAGILSEATATRTPIGTSQGTIYGVASTQIGAISTRTASVGFVAAEDITTAGSGGHIRIGTTLPGDDEVTFRLDLRSKGHVWIGGNERGALLVDPNGAQASKILTASANVSDGDTVTIDAVVYTFESGAIDAAYKVDIGATTAESIDNLIDAINLTGTAGTTYGTGTLVHPTVHALSLTSSTASLEVVAKTSGTAGNSIAISESSGVLSWAGGATTLSGGEEANLTHLGVKGDPNGFKVELRADSVLGGAANIAYRMASRGTAYVHTDDPLVVNSTATSIATVGAGSYTAAQLIGGIIVRDCAGAGRTDTLPDADDLVAAIPSATIGDTVRCWVVNGSDAAETITLAEGVGGAWDANQTAGSRVIPQNTSKMVHLRLTNVTAASEAYVVYA